MTTKRRPTITLPVEVWTALQGQIEFLQRQVERLSGVGTPAPAPPPIELFPPEIGAVIDEMAGADLALQRELGRFASASLVSGMTAAQVVEAIRRGGDLPD